MDQPIQTVPDHVMTEARTIVGDLPTGPDWPSDDVYSLHSGWDLVTRPRFMADVVFKSDAGEVVMATLVKDAAPVGGL